MNASQRAKLYSDEYHHQVGRRDQIESRLLALAPVVAIVGTLIGFLGTKALETQSLLSDVMFAFLILAAAVSFILSLFFYSAAIYGYTYLYLPAPDTVERYYEEMLDLYQQTDPGQARGWADSDLQAYVSGEHIRLATHNTLHNDAKMVRTARCILTLIVSMFVTLVAFVQYFLVTLGA